MRKFSETKRIRAAITRSPTDGSGRFTAMVSPFGPPPDSQGDVVMPGAYAKTIVQATIEHPGELWGIWYDHLYESPDNVIGLVTAAAESKEGLVIAGRLDLENPTAVGVYEALLAGTLRETSIGFGVVEKHWGEIDGKPVRFLDELELLEVSIVWKGVARTRMIEVRSEPAYVNNTSGSTAAVTWTATPAADPELAEINARLDAI